MSKGDMDTLRAQLEDRAVEPHLVRELLDEHQALLAACRLFVRNCEYMYRNPGKENYWFDEPYNVAKEAIAKSEGAT